MTLGDFLNTLQWILGIGLVILGWIARELWSAVKALKDDLIKLKDDVSVVYVRKDDFKDFRDEVRGFLQRIEAKLDTKVDK